MLKYLLYFLTGSGLIAGITVIAERKSPSIAGILMALPTITFISLLFIAMEHGTEFASRAAVWNPAGLVADIVFLGLFACGTRVSRGNSPLIIVMLLAFLGYFSSILMLRYLPISSGFQSLALLWIACIAAYILFRRLGAGKFESAVTASSLQILFRGIFGGIVVSGIMYLGDTAGPLWSGIFSSFPGTMMPVLLLLYLGYGREMTDSVIRDSPLGLVGTGLYSCSIWLLYPFAGIALGTAMAFLILIAFLLAISLLRMLYKQRF